MNKTNFKNLLKFLPFIIIGIIVYGLVFYNIYVIQYDIYKKYNGMGGVVENCYKSHNGYYVCDVVLEDGTRGQDIYNNAYNGMSFINKVEYNRYFGLYGNPITSYNVNYAILYFILVVVFYMFLIVSLVVFLFWLYDKYYNLIEEKIS